MKSKKLNWMVVTALSIALVGGAALYFANQSNPSGLTGLFSNESIDQTIVHTPEAEGNYLIQISQVHQSLEVSNVEKVAQTVAVQKNIAQIVKHFMQQGLPLSICTEGMVDKQKWLEDVAGESADIETFRQDVKAALAKDDLKGVVLALEGWKDFHQSNFISGYAQSRVFYALGVTIKEAPAVVVILPKGLAEYANIGQDLIYYSGALKVLVAEGLIKPENLVACEDMVAYDAVGEALTGGDYTKMDTDADEAKIVRLQELREDKLLNKMFAQASDEKLMVVILGGYHDLSNNVAAYNKKNKTDFGYVEVVPKGF